MTNKPPVVLDVRGWANALRQVSVDASKLPLAERTDENGEQFRRRSMRLVLELVDAIGEFKLLQPAVIALHQQFADAVVYRWPLETVEAAVEGLAQARTEGRVNFAQMIEYGDGDGRERAQEQTDEIVAKVSRLLGEDVALS